VLAGGELAVEGYPHVEACGERVEGFNHGCGGADGVVEEFLHVGVFPPCMEYGHSLSEGAGLEDPATVGGVGFAAFKAGVCVECFLVGVQVEEVGAPAEGLPCVVDDLLIIIGDERVIFDDGVGESVVGCCGDGRAVELPAEGRDDGARNVVQLRLVEDPRLGLRVGEVEVREVQFVEPEIRQGAHGAFFEGFDTAHASPCDRGRFFLGIAMTIPVMRAPRDTAPMRRMYQGRGVIVLRMNSTGPGVVVVAAGSVSGL